MNHKDQQKHLLDIAAIQKTLRENTGFFSLSSHSSSNTLRNGHYKKGHHSLGLSGFTSYLVFNPHEKWITVEPRVTFSDLCEFTLRAGLIPPVVPEFGNITVGGAVMGAALESSSHRFGQFNDQCLEYEVILGNGEKILASPFENSDLFYALAGSYGTLGIITAIKLKLIPAKPYVNLQYFWSTPQEAIHKLTSPIPSDYAEGIVYHRSEAVVIQAQLSDQIIGPIHRQNHFWSPWFAQHVQNQRPQKETMTLKEYLFRYNRGAFWIGRYILSLPILIRLCFHLGIPTPQTYPLNPSLLQRLLFGWMFSSEKLYRIWHRVPNEISEKLFLIHDFYTPFPQAAKTLESFMEKTSLFPIWLCPIQGTHTPQFLSPHYGHDHFLNIGLYGIPQHTSIPTLSAQLEQEILTYNGRKMLYSFTYYDELTFDAIYHGNHYRTLRKKYHATDTFPTLHQKIARITH